VIKHLQQLQLRLSSLDSASKDAAAIRWAILEIATLKFQLETARDSLSDISNCAHLTLAKT